MLESESIQEIYNTGAFLSDHWSHYASVVTYDFGPQNESWTWSFLKGKARVSGQYIVYYLPCNRLSLDEPNVETFDWHHVMTTAVEPNGQMGRLVILHKK